MSRFNLKVNGLVTSATANTKLTLLALKFPNTLGMRGRLRRLVLAGGGGAPQDMQLSAEVRRSGNTTDGTSTVVATSTIGKADPLSKASDVSAIGSNFTAEPTTIEGATIAGGSFNARGQLILEWYNDEGPIWGINQTLLVQVAPGSATATTLEADVEWDEGF